MFSFIDNRSLPFNLRQDYKFDITPHALTAWGDWNPVEFCAWAVTGKWGRHSSWFFAVVVSETFNEEMYLYSIGKWNKTYNCGKVSQMMWSEESETVSLQSLILLLVCFNVQQWLLWAHFFRPYKVHKAAIECRQCHREQDKCIEAAARVFYLSTIYTYPKNIVHAVV
jgi:hypothetical protein